MHPHTGKPSALRGHGPWNRQHRRQKTRGHRLEGQPAQARERAPGGRRPATARPGRERPGRGSGGRAHEARLPWCGCAGVDPLPAMDGLPRRWYMRHRARLWLGTASDRPGRVRSDPVLRHQIEDLSLILGSLGVLRHLDGLSMGLACDRALQAPEVLVLEICRLELGGHAGDQLTSQRQLLAGHLGLHQRLHRVRLGDLIGEAQGLHPDHLRKPAHDDQVLLAMHDQAGQPHQIGLPQGLE